MEPGGRRLSESTRGIYTVDKAHCWNIIVADPSGGQCNNGCHYCYDQQYSRVREIWTQKNGGLKPFNIDTVIRQLNDKGSLLMKKLSEHPVIRIGALGDIRKDDRESYRNYRLLLQAIWAHGIKYILVTKSCHSIDSDMLKIIRDHNGLLNPTTAYYWNKSARKFEEVGVVPPRGRRRLAETAIDMGIQVVLRLNPMHPDYMSDHVKTLEWFGRIGGTRIILETLRIQKSWIKNMPGVDFSKYVTPAHGGVYNNYLTPPRDMQESIFKSMIEIAKINGIDNVTICGDMESQELLGMKATDCCQICSIYGLPVPKKVWEETNE